MTGTELPETAENALLIQPTTPQAVSVAHHKRLLKPHSAEQTGPRLDLKDRGASQRALSSLPYDLQVGAFAFIAST